MKQNKFKVGDIVKANKRGNGEYGITCERNAFIGRVVRVEVDSDGNERICVETISGNELCKKGERFPFVLSKCFDLIRREIHITVDGDKTIAVLKENGKVTKRAEAKRNPEDKFDFETGADIALKRLFGHEVHISGDGKVKLFVKPVKEVKRPAEVGEYIKIVNPICTGDTYKAGDILKVYKTENGSGRNVFCEMGKKLPESTTLNNDKGNVIICEDEYVVLENYEPPKEKPAFVPHLKCSETNYGVIGKQTNYKDAIGRPLAVGDTVELYDYNNTYHGEYAIVERGGEAFVMSIRPDCDEKKGTTGKWKIIKKRGYDEIADGEQVFVIKYIKTEKGR